MVLLENCNVVLLLKKNVCIVLVGLLVDLYIDMLGSWFVVGKDKQIIMLCQGLQVVMGGQGKLVYVCGVNIMEDKYIVDYFNFLNWDDLEVVQDKCSFKVMIDEVVKVVCNVEVIVVVVGELCGMLYEFFSCILLLLLQSQLDLFKVLKVIGKLLVLVLMNGWLLDLNWVCENVLVILEIWYIGIEGGNVIVDLFFGDVNFFGKLFIIFLCLVGQILSYYNYLCVGCFYIEGKLGNYILQYFDELNGLLYLFGYGLSYIEFKFFEVCLLQLIMMVDGKVQVSVMVKNMGCCVGVMVVQLYICDVVVLVVCLVKELKDFCKVMLQLGEEKEVQFSIDCKVFFFYNVKLEYVVELGEFQVQIGLDFKDVKMVLFNLQ